MQRFLRAAVRRSEIQSRGCVARAKNLELSTKQTFNEALLAELDALYRTAAYLSGDRALAEELVQEVAVKAIQGQATFRKDANFRSWLFAILRHTMADYYRKSGGRPTAISLEAIQLDGVCLHDNGATALREASLEQTLFDQVWDEEVADALGELPDEMRLAVLLADVEGVSYQEIATVMDWPLGSVMSRLHRGRQKLRERLLLYAEHKGYQI